MLECASGKTCNIIDRINDKLQNSTTGTIEEDTVVRLHNVASYFTDKCLGPETDYQKNSCPAIADIMAWLLTLDRIQSDLSTALQQGEEFTI